MPVNFVADQLNTVTKLQNICSIILDQLHLASIISQEAIDMGYGPAGANAITDALLQTPIGGAAQGPFPKLVAQDVFNAVAQIQAIENSLTITSRLGYTKLEKMRP